MEFVDFIDNPEIAADDYQSQAINATQGLGFTEDKDYGNTQTGKMQISARNNFEHADVGKPLGEAGHTGSHETGHILGLPHNDIDGNLMRDGGNSNDLNITPAQRSDFLKNIPEKK